MRAREAHHPIRAHHVGLTAAACSMLIAGCGSNSSATPGSPGQGNNQPNTAQIQQDAAAFTDCLRAHGVAGLVDPGAAGLKRELAPGTQHSPAFVAALPACSHLLPQGGPSDRTVHSPTRIAAALAFARCIRSHGFPSFPDPTSTGQLTYEAIAAAGINIHQPAVLQAGEACAPVTHGFITRANVARFIAEH